MHKPQTAIMRYSFSRSFIHSAAEVQLGLHVIVYSVDCKTGDRQKQLHTSLLLQLSTKICGEAVWLRASPRLANGRSYQWDRSWLGALSVVIITLTTSVKYCDNKHETFRFSDKLKFNAPPATVLNWRPTLHLNMCWWLRSFGHW
jgi:hypothetical protein